MKDTACGNGDVSHQAVQIFSLFVLNAEFELAGVITVAAESADDARGKFEVARSARQHLLSVSPVPGQAV